MGNLSWRYFSYIHIAKTAVISRTKPTQDQANQNSSIDEGVFRVPDFIMELLEVDSFQDRENHFFLSVFLLARFQSPTLMHL